MLSVGVILSQFSRVSSNRQVEEYTKALKLSDLNEFRYAQDHMLGKSFSYYELSAIDPQSMPELLGNYLSIERVTEKEILKSKKITKHHTDKRGKPYTTSYTEYYYEWEVVGRDYLQSDRVILNGQICPTSSLRNLPNERVYLNNSVVAPDYRKLLSFSNYYLYRSLHERISFYATSAESKGSMYLDLSDALSSQVINLYPNTEVHDLYNQYVLEAKSTYIAFCLFWILLTLGITIKTYLCFDN